MRSLYPTEQQTAHSGQYVLVIFFFLISTVCLTRYLVFLIKSPNNYQVMLSPPPQRGGSQAAHLVGGREREHELRAESHTCPLSTAVQLG